MKRWALPVVAIVVMMASLVAAIVARREVHARRTEAEQLRAEVQQWKAKAEASAKDVEALRAAQGLEPEEHAEHAAAPPKAADDLAVRRELVKLLAEKDEKLSAAAKDLRAVARPGRGVRTESPDIDRGNAETDGLRARSQGPVGHGPAADGSLTNRNEGEERPGDAG